MKNMKTALSELIEKWESELGSYIPNATIYKAFIDEAKTFLDREQKQIETAYTDGFQSTDIESDYFKKTYGTDN